MHLVKETYRKSYAELNQDSTYTIAGILASTLQVHANLCSKLLPTLRMNEHIKIKLPDLTKPTDQNI